ncbi:MAG: hypothetical protein KKB70_02615 [Proteobacteria bacterium]|nr:hypothetical protein [Pseudomonadota bacterium]
MFALKAKKTGPEKAESMQKSFGPNWRFEKDVFPFILMGWVAYYGLMSCVAYFVSWQVYLTFLLLAGPAMAVGGFLLYRRLVRARLARMAEESQQRDAQPKTVLTVRIPQHSSSEHRAYVSNLVRRVAEFYGASVEDAVKE